MRKTQDSGLKTEGITALSKLNLAFAAVGTLTGIVIAIFAVLVWAKIEPNHVVSWWQQIRPITIATAFGVFGLLIGIALGYFLLKRRPAVGPSRLQLNNAPVADASLTIEKSGEGVGVFKSWSGAYPILSTAKKSIVIVDSFLLNEVGPIEECIEKAALQTDVNRLRVSIYMASPKKKFGAQRIREKEPPPGTYATFEEMVQQYKGAMGNFISINDWNVHIDRFNQSFTQLEALKKRLLNSKIDFEIRTYPTMPTTRIFVVDNSDYFFGWFPLLAQNPGYVCCHLSDDGSKGAGKALADALQKQVKIIDLISDPAASEERRED